MFWIRFRLRPANDVLSRFVMGEVVTPLGPPIWDPGYIEAVVKLLLGMDCVDLLVKASGS